MRRLSTGLLLSIAFALALPAPAFLSQRSALATETTPDDPADILQEQRSRGQAAARILDRKVSTFESDHFIVHVTVDETQVRDVPKLAEDAYRRFFSVMAAQESEFVWKGKVVVYVLGPAQFTEFSRQAHGREGGAREAYFRAVLDQAELVLPWLDAPDRFRQDLTHEATHLLLHFYRSPGHVPNWLQEGLAQWFEFDAFPDCAARRQAHDTVARDSTKVRMRGLADLIKGNGPKSASDLSGYAYSWSFTAFLMDTRRPELLQFIGLLKRDVDQDRAARQAFAKDLTALEREWAVSAK